MATKARKNRLIALADMGVITDHEMKQAILLLEHSAGE
jgi:hypothetical protein